MLTMNENDKVKVYGFGRLELSNFTVFLDGELATVLEVNDNANSVWLDVKGRGKVLVHARQCEKDLSFKNVLNIFKKGK